MRVIARRASGRICGASRAAARPHVQARHAGSSASPLEIVIARIKIIIAMAAIGGIRHRRVRASIDETSAETMTWMAGAGPAVVRAGSLPPRKMITRKG